MRKPVFVINENKGTHQLHSNHAVDQRLCFFYIDSIFFYIDSTIPLLPKSEISSHEPYSVAVQPKFVSDLHENLKDRFSHDVAH